MTKQEQLLLVCKWAEELDQNLSRDENYNRFLCNTLAGYIHHNLLEVCDVNSSEMCKATQPKNLLE